MPAPHASRMPFGRLHGPATVLGKVVTGLVVVAGEEAKLMLNSCVHCGHLLEKILW